MSETQSQDDFFGEYDEQFGSGFLTSSQQTQISVVEDDKGREVTLDDPKISSRYYKGYFPVGKYEFTKQNRYHLVVNGDVKHHKKLSHVATVAGGKKIRVSFKQ